VVHPCEYLSTKLCVVFVSRTDPQFNLRIPEELKDLVVAAARENKRSATAEILARLERSFSEPNEMGWSDSERLKGQGIFKSEAQEQAMDGMVIIGDEAHRTSAPELAETDNESLKRAFKALKELNQVFGLTAVPVQKERPKS